MALRTIPPRLHVLLARDSRAAVVIRRGPSKTACTIGWDRAKDSFQVGQWLRGRIYERRCDLSPDGRHMIYFAMNGHWETRVKGSWTAISRVPYLKAIGLWAKGNCWNGGGLFHTNRGFWLNDGFLPHEALEPPGDRLLRSERAPDPPRGGNNECLGVYFARLLRDGWAMGMGEGPGDCDWVMHFEKRINAHWSLRKRAYASLRRPPGRGVYYDEHALFNARTGEFIDKPGWEWAELDGKRLVWAEGGCLYAGRAGKNGLGEPRLLKDFNAMTFERIVAPY